MDYISKGRAHNRSEFGVKMDLVASLSKPFIQATHALTGRPYDDNILMRSLAQAKLNKGVAIKTAVVHRGCRGHDAWAGARIVMPWRRSRTPGERRWRRTRLRRRSMIEALIGHMKVDGLIGRNWLKGTRATQCTRSGAPPVRICALIRGVLEWLKSLASFPLDPARGRPAQSVGFCA